ncbi:ABC-2 type transporter-domain-containing protein [Lineolata rhizophorae]|uniref:ABC-2 type transporter-domain-containing protein n=1 Tax=Lineolata rhizophorae TaxID=578093 RepID=A0A6A6NQM8_9PEZI|nr:ABC-2 type transporter-domain-containing protein [Lineolata rhizophorae]
MSSGNAPPSDLPGAWPNSAGNSRQQSYRSGAPRQQSDRVLSPLSTSTPAPQESSSHDDAGTTAAGNGSYDHDHIDSAKSEEYEKSLGTPDSDEKGAFAPIKSSTSTHPDRPRNLRRQTSKGITEDELFKALSHRRTTHSGGKADSIATADPDENEEQAEINRLLSRMFGQTRQANSEEEKTRHVGVVFKNLTVKGMGLGAALQPTTGDIFMGFPRFLKNLFKLGPRKAAGKPPVRTIIDNFSGCIKPGEMLLVLGRPGSGCSTFLKVIGNQRFGYESVEGDVTYGGTDSRTMAKKYRGEILYNPEDDLHYATLKVKDTLSFALKTRTPGKDSRREGETRDDYVREFLRVVSKLFWIEHTMNTKVGNEMIRGVSGGEKKRVSIAEAMITKASTQCWDNSTRGLDASTALEYVQSLRSLTNMAHISTCVALYQAGESLYELFDKVLLLDEGKCCYFGPTEDAARYFKDLGFVQPERWTTADFLTSVTDEHERHVREGWEDRIPRSPEQFAEAFAKSELHERNLAEIAEFEADTQRMVEERHANQGEATKKKNFTIPFHRQVMACTKRQFLVLLGDKQSLVGKWGGVLFQSLIVGSLFYDLPQTSSGVFTRGGVMFFVLLFNALLALAELTAAFESRPILLKHKSFSFYRPSAFAIAQSVVDVPLVLVQVTLFDVVVYFMANLQRTASQFFISLLLLFSITMTMYAFFRAIGALAGSLDVATRITGVAIQALVVYTGYLIPRTKQHPWFSWITWINPVQYGFEALMSNEFYNLEIQCEPPYVVPQVPGASPEFQSCTIQGSQPGSLVVSGADYIDVAYEYSRSHLWRNFGFIWAFFAFFLFLTAVGMELQKPNKGGGAVTIFRRGQAPSTVKKAMEHGKPVEDEESGKKTEGNSSASDEDETAGAGSSSEDETAKVAGNEAIFTFQNVTYRIPYEGGERTLLENVQGFVQPGKLTALMGASGAGKTTLLNALAQRIRFGVVTGDFLVDGRPLPRSFQRSSGFAEQMDVHEPTATVREALRFSAKLRQPREVPVEDKYAYCERIIDLLEMRDIAGAVIGTVGAGLNQEQRKRLTIAVELAAKPDLLMFLDEPTSGLDSQAAFNIVRFLRKLAEAGQAILCTIHQPSSVLFEHFDRLLLLKSGGRTVYFGELGHDSRKLIDYLERNGAKKCAPEANPAEYMLDAIGAGNPDYKGQDWGEVWEKSAEKAELTREIEGIISSRRRSVTASPSTGDEREYAMPLGAQVATYVKRSFVSIWRKPEYVIGMFMLHIFTGLFNAFTFWDLGQSSIDFQSRLFSVFMTLTISPPLIQQLQPRYLEARNLFEGRESNSKIYSWVALVTGIVLSEIPYRLVAGTVYWACWYWPPHFPRDSYTAASMWAFVMAFELFYLGMGQAIASFSPNDLLASLLVPIFFTFVVSFCGVVVPAAALPGFWHAWMYPLTPFRYLLEGMLGLVIHEQPLRCDQSELAVFSAPQGQSCQEYAGQYAQQAGGYVQTMDNGMCGFCQYASGDQFGRSFSVYYSHVWRDYGIFWAYIAFQFIVVYFCSWLYLQGGRKMIDALNPKTRKNRKEMRRREQQHNEGVDKA